MCTTFVMHIYIKNLRYDAVITTTYVCTDGKTLEIPDRQLNIFEIVVNTCNQIAK